MTIETDYNASPWPKRLRYAYFLFSTLRFRSYPEWCAEGEPNPFLRLRRRRRQTNQQEIADIFEMTSKEISDFTKAQGGRVPDKRRPR